MYPYLLVAVGGGLGAALRYGVGDLVGKVWTGSFPLGIFLINVTGSLVMGLFVGLMAKWLPEWQGQARLFFAVGILGGFTTFSTFSLDVITLIERGEIASALLYVLLSVVVSVGALYLGLLMTRGAA